MFIKALMISQQAQAQNFMPTEGTEIAGRVDSLYAFLLVTSAIACAILIGGMIYFALKYKRRTDTDKTAYITHNTFLEFLWSFIPLVIFLGVFAWGWIIYNDMRSFPKDALEVHVFGRQWAWEVQYKSGVTSNEIVVPVNRDVKIILTATDVLHSFYIPSFRIKQDAVPGRYTALWFRANKMGEFHVFCTEYCGTSHSGMITKLRVVSQTDYDKWLEEASNFKFLPLVDQGKQLFTTKGCVACHDVDAGTVKVGPSLHKKFNTQELLADGSAILVDENYVRESILNPSAKWVKGFTAAMPSFQGQLSEMELNALIEFIKSKAQ